MRHCLSRIYWVVSSSLTPAPLPGHNQLSESFSFSCLHPAAPARYSIEDYASHHCMIKHLQHGSTDVERPQSPEKKTGSSEYTFTDPPCFRPVQLIIYVDTEVLVILDNVHFCSFDNDWVVNGSVATVFIHFIMYLLLTNCKKNTYCQ